MWRAQTEYVLQLLHAAARWVFWQTCKVRKFVSASLRMTRSLLNPGDTFILDADVDRFG